MFAGSQTFVIEEVRVEGVRHLTREDVLKMAAIPRGATVFQVSTRTLGRAVDSDPWVASVRVERELPDAMVITVEERVPVAVVDGGGAELWVVSRDGFWLGMRTSKESTVPVIRDLASIEPRAGEAIGDPVLRNAIALVDGLSDELLAQARELSAPSIEKTALITDQDVQVFFGEADQVELKDRIARELLEKERGRVVYINVRVVESPTWRGIGN
jgi:cell division protein FtsQ